MVEYGLLNTTNLIQNLIYICFGIILTQFYINFSIQEHQIEINCSTPKILRFQPIPPFIFPFSPFKIPPRFFEKSGVIVLNLEAWYWPHLKKNVFPQKLFSALCLPFIFKFKLLTLIFSQFQPSACPCSLSQPDPFNTINLRL